MALIEKLEAIGDAIRAKTGGTELLTLDAMPQEIAAIETGGGGVDIPEEAFNMTGNISSTFANNNWKWFYDAYKNKIKFNDVLNAGSLFEGCSYENLDVELNMAKNGNQNGFSNIFINCSKLKQVNFKVNGTLEGINTHGIFQYCYNLREITNSPFKDCDMSYYLTTSSAQQQNWFMGCKSLRKIDRSFWDNIVISRTASYGHLYGSLYQDCAALDELYLPIDTRKTPVSTCFTQQSLSGCYRAKSVIFQTNEDGSPIVVNWKNQNVDLGNGRYIGYGSSSASTSLLSYNSGVTQDDKVYDDATYELNKNNENYWTDKIQYSRYNHDSALETINSLPDASVYVAANGGSNTITLKGEAGSATDGGAINTLTAEEIAVAAAKGWTVSFN